MHHDSTLQHFKSVSVAVSPLIVIRKVVRAFRQLLPPLDLATSAAISVLDCLAEHTPVISCPTNGQLPFRLGIIPRVVSNLRFVHHSLSPDYLSKQDNNCAVA